MRIGSTLLRFLILFVAVATLVGGGWFVYQQFGVATVTVTDAVTGPVVQAFYATGTLVPDREYPIKSNVEGIVTEVLVDKGQQVKKGDPLAVVRSEDYLMKHSQAKAQYELAKKLADPENSPVLAEFKARIESAREQAEVARREYERLSKLVERDAASVSEFDRASEQLTLMQTLIATNTASMRTKQLELTSESEVAEAALDIAQWNLDQQTIASPIDGWVLDRPVSVGTRVPVNGHLMQIANVAPEALVMRANVDEEDKTRVSIGQEVKISLYAYEGRIFTGRVKEIYPQADLDRRTFEVDIEIAPPDPKFAAGMTGELAFVVAEKASALVIPSQAVQEGQVWIVRDGRAEPVDVQIGLRSIERVEVLSGLEAGELVLISPAAELEPGQSVNTEYLDPATAAGLNKPSAETL